MATWEMILIVAGLSTGTAATLVFGCYILHSHYCQQTVAAAQDSATAEPSPREVFYAEIQAPPDTLDTSGTLLLSITRTKRPRSWEAAPGTQAIAI